MTLNEYAYEILELLRRELTDDFYIDLRLIKQLIRDQRELVISNAINKGGSGPQSATGSGYDGGWDVYVQTMDVIMEDVTCPESTPCFEKPRLWVSTNEFPTPMVLGRRPAIIRVMAHDANDCHIKEKILFTSADRARVVGNGRFNSKAINTYIRNDKFWMTSQDVDIADDLTLVTDAIFRDPRDVPTFDEDTDDYPLGKNWPYMVEPILRNLRIKLNSGQDYINDAADLPSPTTRQGETQ